MMKKNNVLTNAESELTSLNLIRLKEVIEIINSIDKNIIDLQNSFVGFDDKIDSMFCVNLVSKNNDFCRINFEIDFAFNTISTSIGYCKPEIENIENDIVSYFCGRLRKVLTNKIFATFFVINENVVRGKYEVINVNNYIIEEYFFRITYFNLFKKEIKKEKTFEPWVSLYAPRNKE